MKTLLSIAIALFATISQAEEYIAFKVDADRTNCVYQCGETSTIRVTAVDTNGVVLKKGRVSVKFDNFGDRKLCPDRTVDLSKENPFSVVGTRQTPGFLRLKLTPEGKDVFGIGNMGYDGRPRRREPYYYGVAFEPERIQPGGENPSDFDAFWAKAIRDCERDVPLDPKMELIPEYSKGDVNVYRVSFATVQNRRVYGWLVEPKDLSKGPFKTRIGVPGAGKGAMAPKSACGCTDLIYMVVNVHTYEEPVSNEIGEPDAHKKRYEQQKEQWAKPFGVSDYYLAGIHLGRERYFYYATILGINRAINWLAQRPECDRSRISYAGTSQGGGFGLILTALNKNISRSCIYVPALTDLLGFRVEERESGWPRLIEGQKPENRAEAERWAPYFCGANFARRITCPIRFVVGFADEVCPPHAGYAAFNVCPSKDKMIYNGIGMYHAVYKEFYSEVGAWQLKK